MVKPKRFQVYGLGQCSLDYLGKVENHPMPDSKCEFTDLTTQGGGPTATALVALSRWGISCTFSGVVGDDSYGRDIRESLENEGVDTQGLIARKGTRSQFAFIAVEPKMARRTIFWQRPTGMSLKPAELNYDMIRKATVLHTDGLFLEASLAACKTARQAGRLVVVDGGTLREGMLDLVPFSDYFVVSETFSKAFSPNGDPVETCRKLSAMGPAVTAVTLGKRGYVAVIHGKVVRKRAHSVEAIDTTGCGDAFHAALTYGTLHGWDAEKSFQFGAWVAAEVSLKLGGRTGIPSHEKLQEKGYA